MELIIKDIDTWIIILKGLDKLKDKYGSSIIDKYIKTIEAMRNSKIVSLGEEQAVGSFLTPFGFEDINALINFLYSIKDMYRFESQIRELGKLREKYGVDKVAFINNGAQKRLRLETYLTANKVRKAYFAKDVYPFLTVDLKTNGINELAFMNTKPFIVQDMDLNSHTRERVLYTADFRLKCETLPLKEEMDKQDILIERDEIFVRLLEYLHVMLNEIDINLIKADPNVTYLKSETFDFDKYYTVRCDGVLKDRNRNELRPVRREYISTPEILVENANFMVIAAVVDGVITEINLIVSPSYLEHIYPQLTSDLTDLLTYLESNSANLNLQRIMFR